MRPLLLHFGFEGDNIAEETRSTFRLAEVPVWSI
jgi:hypothetical protein